MLGDLESLSLRLPHPCRGVCDRVGILTFIRESNSALLMGEALPRARVPHFSLPLGEVGIFSERSPILRGCHLRSWDFCGMTGFSSHMRSWHFRGRAAL